jgi:hypothetical protein
MILRLRILGPDENSLDARNKNISAACYASCGGWKESGPPEPVVQPRLIVSWKSSTDPTRIEKHELLPGPVIDHR